jgi:hypothetical protein
MKNERTPRTLADCQWRTGYQSANPQPRSNWAGWWLAVVIGVSLALVLAYGGRA